MRHGVSAPALGSKGGEVGSCSPENAMKRCVLFGGSRPSATARAACNVRPPELGRWAPGVRAQWAPRVAPTSVVRPWLCVDPSQPGRRRRRRCSRRWCRALRRGDRAQRRRRGCRRRLAGFFSPSSPCKRRSSAARAAALASRICVWSTLHAHRRTTADTTCSTRPP